MAGAVKRYNFIFVGGDFNMALFLAQEALRDYSIDALFWGSYAWRDLEIRGSGVVGLPGCRYDSLGFFAVKPAILLLPHAQAAGVARRPRSQAR